MQRRDGLRTGIATFVPSVEQHAGRGTASARRLRPSAAARDARSAGAAHAERRESARAGGKFRGEWLQFRNIDVVKPDSLRFRDFDESLRYSMRRETELFADNILR
jgi:Protein of unknown function (DUF1592)